jgi:hypothetical protein
MSNVLIIIDMIRENELKSLVLQLGSQFGISRIYTFTPR